MPHTPTRIARRLAQAAALMTAGWLSACGGGGGDATPPPDASPKTGTLQGAPALDFDTTSGLKGSTDAQGRFSWREGDRVAFRIGRLVLGTAAAAERLTLVDVAGARRAAEPAALRLLRVLQTVDTDGDLSNGLAIDAAVRQRLAGLPGDLDLATVPDSALQSRVVDAALGSIAKPLASADAALVAFAGQQVALGNDAARNLALAGEAKAQLASMDVASFAIGGNLRSCSSFSGAGQTAQCAADWATILAQDPAFAGIDTARIDFGTPATAPTFTYSITQARIDALSALPASIVRPAQKTQLVAALAARLADTARPRTQLAFAAFDGGKPEAANGPAFWNGAATADFDLVVRTLCGTSSPVDGTQCRITDAAIATLEAATFSTPGDRPKVALLLRRLQQTLGTGAVFYRRDATGATATPNLRAAFLDPALSLAADGTAPVLGLTAGLNTLEVAALREGFVDANPQTARRLEGRTVAFQADRDAQDILTQFVAAARRLAGGAQPVVGVVTSGAENPLRDHDLNVFALRSAGARVVYLPFDGGLRRTLDTPGGCAFDRVFYTAYANTASLSVNFHMDQAYPDVAALRTGYCADGGASLAAAIAGLNGIYFAGGDQARHLESLATRDGAGALRVASPQLAQLRERFAAGQLVVGGTSAGAAVQSGGSWKNKPVPMLGGGQSWNALSGGFVQGAGPTTDDIGTTGVRYAEGGFGFFRYGVIDQHFSQRTREGRLVRAVADAGLDYGFGVDENTTLVTSRPDARGTVSMAVLGTGGVYVVDVRGATAGGAPWRIAGARTHYLAAGDRLEIDAAGALTVQLGTGKPLVDAVPGAPTVTQRRVQEYNSGNYLKLAQAIALTGAAGGRGTTLGSSGQEQPAYAVTLARGAATRMRAAGNKVSYSDLELAWAPCPDAACTAP